MNMVTKRFCASTVLIFTVLASVIFVPAQKTILKSQGFKTSVNPNETRLYTEKNIYAVGENVRFSGSGFGKFEQVALSVERVNEFQKVNDLTSVWTLAADENGNINGEWLMPFDGRFVIKAAGTESGARGETVVSASVAPIVVAGNPNCGTLNASSDPAFAHITSNFGFKKDPPASGTFAYTNSGGELTGGAPADPANSLTIALQNTKTFNWSSTRPITAVIVKGGPQANVYPYNPASLGDTTLSTVGAGADISHIEVCFGAPVASLTVIKDAQPNSPQSFAFTATGQITQNFSLVDNGVTGPDRIQFTNLTGFGAGNTITVTEGASSPFSLTQINCTSGGSGVENNTINVQARFATVQLEAGENVVCTFVNAITTAASVSASGRVLDAAGYPISRTLVTIQNTTNGATKSVMTNSFGYYLFDNLPAGDFYIISVSHRRYAFSQGTQAFVLNDAVENMNFTADAQ